MRKSRKKVAPESGWLAREMIATEREDIGQIFRDEVESTVERYFAEEAEKIAKKASKPRHAFQDHYDKCRLVGCDHISYVVLNDLSKEDSDQLRQTFEASHHPVPREVQGDFKVNAYERAADAELRDNLAWLTGTGYYSQ